MESNKKMSLKDVEYCVNPQKLCKDCKYCDEDYDCRGEAFTIAAKIVEEKIESKKQEVIDKAIEKIGISRDLIDQCYYPVRRMNYIDDDKHACEFKETTVCITLKQLSAIGSPINLLVFGLEDEEIE